MSRRNRGQRKVFPDFPYDRKFTKAELDEIFARQDRLIAAFRDAVGPNGWGLGLPEDHLQMLMFHGALAGVDVDDNKAYIRPRTLPDASGRYVDSVEWVLKKHDSPRTRVKDARREARARVKELDDLDPEVRAAMLDMFIRKSRRADARNLGALPPDEATETESELAAYAADDDTQEEPR